MNSAGFWGFLLNITQYGQDTPQSVALVAGINIILILILVPPFGSTRAVVATAISMITWNIILWWFVRK